MLKFALITDIHYGSDKGWKLGTQAPKLIEHFVKSVNQYKPDFVVSLGDYINASSNKEDKKNLSSLKKQFNDISAPVYPILGNNEVRNLSSKDYREIMQAPSNSYTKSYKGYDFIFWNPSVNTDGPNGLKLKEADLEWLEKALHKNTQKTILFSHIPLDNSIYDDMISAGRDGNPHKSYYKGAHKVRKILEDSNKVVLCMAGHKHTNRHREINGIHYVTNQSFIQSYNGKQPLGAYYFIEADNNEITIHGHGFHQPTLTLNTGLK
jgi:predicted phosphodiesterase